MTTKNLLAGLVLALGTLVTTSTAQAQSLLNPMSWFGPGYNSAPAYGPANCPNGNCNVYRPAYYNTPNFGQTVPNYGQVGAYYNQCPNGNCAVGVCANGNCGISCANGQCKTGPCVNGVCPTGYRVPAYAPVNQVMPSYYRAPVQTNGVRNYPVPQAGNGWNVNTAASVPRTYNSSNSPFYP